MEEDSSEHLEKKQKPQIVKKPWGQEIIYADTVFYTGKIMEINEGHRLSIHYHLNKDETFYLLDGNAVLQLDHEDENYSKCTKIQLLPGDCFRIRPMKLHSLEALADSRVLEVSTHNPDDVVRVVDRYRRVNFNDPDEGKVIKKIEEESDEDF